MRVNQIISFAALGMTAALFASCGESEVTFGGSACDANDCDAAFCGDKCDRFAHDIVYDTDKDSQEPAVDVDGDTIPNERDNCVDVPNPDQKDSDNNGLGDACDSGEELDDSDGDGIVDLKDNCRLVPNADQKDSDGDGIGDACAETEETHADLDGDTIPDEQDNCPRTANPDQKDSDGDGIGDACAKTNPDLDGDTVPDDADNCPDTPNADQKDSDGDGIGDACMPAKPDADGDTVPDDADNCPNTPNADQKDSDGDGIGDACTSVDGSPEHPFVIETQCGTVYRDKRNTKNSPHSRIDVYPEGKSLNESGPEYYYQIKIDTESQLRIWLDAEPSGVDVDIHLLSDLKIEGKTIPASTFLNRANLSISQSVSPGIYWIVADTYDGMANAGNYVLNVQTDSIYAGTKDDPILLNCGKPISSDYLYVDDRSTADAKSDIFDTYPGWENLDESGPEFIYKFTVKEKMRFHANLRAPEPSGTDTDLHLLSSLKPTLAARSDLRIWEELEPGTYYLTADSFSGKTGRYVLDMQFRPMAVTGDRMFNAYILKAVNYLEKNWARRGYGSSAYTHNLPYGTDTVTKGPKAPLTMCVAAVAETILVAMDLYAKDTGDASIWNHIPASSWQRQNSANIKGYLWVDPSFNGNGTGDALTVFGMGMNVSFKELVPGSFVNLNRTSGTGHAVVFLAFLDANCQEYESYNSNVVGFKYYSSQGSSTNGGFDYRYAVFSNKNMTCPSGKKKDTGVIYPSFDSRAKNQQYLNTGVMYMPKYWQKTSLAQGISISSAPVLGVFDDKKYNGKTLDE